LSSQELEEKLRVERRWLRRDEEKQLQVLKTPARPTAPSGIDPEALD
jgi:hypothetical protein